MNIDIEEFYKAWTFLENHKIFKDKNECYYFSHCLSIDVVKVNPETREIDNDHTKNTEVEIWLECGKWITDEPDFSQGIASHDYELDCGGETFEEVIILLSKLVKSKYGE
jgi:hypothetical protein